MTSEQQSIYPITNERYSGKFWRAYPTLEFARTFTSAPLVLNEIFKAAVSMPIGFSKEKDNRMPMALLGIEADKNLYLSSEGAWYGRYLPAFFRGYPFCVLPDENGTQVLCMDENSGLLNEDGVGWPFFNSDGTPSERIEQTVKFFDELSSGHDQTKEICKTIQDLGLLIPWEISVVGSDGEQMTLDIMDRVDEDALNQLGSDDLHKLQSSGAMAVIYAHLISLQNLQLIERLIWLEGNRDKPDPDPGFSLTEESNRELNFDF